jgi:hypothetical protein
MHYEQEFFKDITTDFLRISDTVPIIMAIKSKIVRCKMDYDVLTEKYRTNTMDELKELINEMLESPIDNQKGSWRLLRDKIEKYEDKQSAPIDLS